MGRDADGLPEAKGRERAQGSVSHSHFRLRVVPLIFPYLRSLADAFNNIPDQLRDQILRLEEQQYDAEEAERLAEREERDARRQRAEAARMASEGAGKGSRGLQKPKTIAFEEELEEDDEAQARDRIAMRGVTGDSEGSDDGEAVVVSSSGLIPTFCGVDLFAHFAGYLRGRLRFRGHGEPG